MDDDWLATGTSASGFAWHGPKRRRRAAAIVDAHHRIKQIWYLERALEMARSVARVVNPNGKTATCFLVAPQLIMTNHHVFQRPEDTDGVQIQFNYRQRYDGDWEDPDVYTCDASTFETDKEMDYTVVGLSTPARLPVLPIRWDEPVQRDGHLAIVQHPNGEALQIAMRDNALVWDDAMWIEYLTNTDYGSSGAPVFDDTWRCVALHSQRVKDPRTTTRTVYYRNRGIKLSAILQNPAVDALIPL